MGLFSKSVIHEFKVKGMGCGACERKITTALNSIKGVKKVNASSDESQVIVTSKGVEEGVLRGVIVDVGYTVE
ncbi:MAG: heavy-metal-associated domain-containing protein [Candidatus Poseidoniaceae archaeon]|jgi:copper chaperone CopZ|nr:heavy-metal-associated domain-containing protein [Candidatus Poseidoniaceae archaeon]